MMIFYSFFFVLLCQVAVAMTARKNATINSKAKIGSTGVDGVSLGSLDSAEDPEVCFFCLFVNSARVKRVGEDC